MPRSADRARAGAAAGWLARFGGDDAPAGMRNAGTRVLLRCLRQAPGTAAVFGVLAASGIGTALLLPRAVGDTVDAVTARAPLAGPLVRLAVVLVAMTVTDVLDGLVAGYYGAGMTARLRRRLVGQALRLGIPGQRRFPAGDLMTRLTVNAAAPANFLPMLVTTAATVVTSIGAVVALALIDWRLVAVFLVGAPLAVLLLRAFLRTAGDPMVRYQQGQSAITVRLLDAHDGARTVRASGTLDREIDRTLEPLPALHEAGRAVWAAQGRASWQLSLVVPLTQVLVLAVGGFALQADAITAGQLVAAASYVGLALGSMGLLDALVSLLHTQVGAGRVGEVLEAQPAPGRTPQAQQVRPPSGGGQVELIDVSLRREGRVVLDHLDLEVPAGTSVALVGASGAGKTTLTSLLGRLADPDEGQVLLDGVPVATLDPAALGGLVTYAFEQPALLGASVHDMIAYARPDTSRAEVRAAARAAAADGFVQRLPHGYDTPLSAAPMSGGERQRLGVARAILAAPRVLVLDDATSSLDTATELQVSAALRRLLAGRTSVIVAHRAGTAARADRVAWLEAGRIRALAPHARLWAEPGYRALFGAGESGPAEPAGPSAAAGRATASARARGDG